MNIGECNPVGTGNQPEQSVAVRPRNAHAARNSVTWCSLRRPERVLPADRRIRTGMEATTTEAAARNEASVHAYAWQRGSNPRTHHHHTMQAANDDFKLIAKTKGIGYQPLMRRVLMEHAASVLADMGREYAASLTPTQPKDE